MLDEERQMWREKWHYVPDIAMHPRCRARLGELYRAFHELKHPHQFVYERRRNVPLTTKRAIYREQKGQCYYCRDAIPAPNTTGVAPNDRAELDHLIPVSRGGNDERDNLAYACHRCNNRKMMFTADEFMQRVPLEPFFTLPLLIPYENGTIGEYLRVYESEWQDGLLRGSEWLGVFARWIEVFPEVFADL